jgi:hypothetical protein
MNFIFGRGETLITQEPSLRQNFPPTEPIYSYEESAERLYMGMEDVLNYADNIPLLAKPNDEIVFALLLHPAYLAKSHFPKKIFKYLNFNIIGSKDSPCTPIKNKKNKKNTRESETTILYYVSIRIETLIERKDSLFTIEDETLQNELTRIESIEPFKHSEKLKIRSQYDTNNAIEVVLHEPENGFNVKSALIKFTNSIDNQIKITYSKTIDGITFLKLHTRHEFLEEITKFTYIRVVRNISKLRSINIKSFKNNEALENVNVNVKFLNADLKVAVLDGGFSQKKSFLNKYVRYTDQYTNGEDENLLTHGTQVTSAVLFGPIPKLSNNANEVQTLYPFSRVDNYKVCDPDMDIYEVLERISEIIEKDKPEFINLSLGPEGEIEDLDIHIWTATLDKYFSTGEYLCTIAIGNEGDTSSPRINVPSDCINGLSVGACDSEDIFGWEKTEYSCIGPGRTPGFMKPDGLAFGGSDKLPFRVISDDQVCSVQGTSFASPYVLRTAIGIKSLFDNGELTVAGIRALLIHNTFKNNFSCEHVGWGKFNTKPTQIMTCNDNEIKVLYQGEVERGKRYKAEIPYPDEGFSGNIDIIATFCFFTSVSTEHSTNYSNYGLEAKLYKTNSKGNTGSVSEFFKASNVYTDGVHITETSLRRDFYKWETTVKGELLNKRGESIIEPYFIVKHNVRDPDGAPSSKKNKLKFALVVNVIAHDMNNLHNLIENKYGELEVMNPRIELKI